MPVLREGTHPVWGACVLIWVGGWLGLDFYWLFTETGLVRTVARWEAHLLDGNWYPKITVMLLLLVQLGILLAIKVLIEKVSGRRLTGAVNRPPAT